MQSEPRYNTDIPLDYFYKYREKPEQLFLFNVFYGDDRNVIRKVVTGSQNGAFFAGTAGILAFFSEQKNSDFTAARGIERVIKHSPPLFLSGLAYGLVVGMLAKIRDKDDFKNHVFGGLASGMVIGSWYKSPATSAYGGILLAGMCGYYKYVISEDVLPLSAPRYKRPFNLYRTGWFTDRPNPEGIQDADQDDTYKRYKP